LNGFVETLTNAVGLRMLDLGARVLNGKRHVPPS
jgi:hypothetical protein